MNAREARSGGALQSFALAASIFAGLIGIAVLPRTCAEHGPLIGKQAPAFELAVVEAGEMAAVATPPAVPPPLTSVKLAGLRGRPVILDFWATWCGPCQMEAPILDRVARRFEAKGLAVVGVNTSDADGKAAGWARAHHLGYPVVYDAGDETAGAYGVQNLPTLVLVGKDGIVRAVRVGMTAERELNTLVEAAL